MVHAAWTRGMSSGDGHEKRWLIINVRDLGLDRLMTGCMVGPNYHRPVVPTPGVYRDLSDNPQAQAQAASFADLPWWQVFQDPQLQELIRTALKENYDLQLATERISAARAQVTITRSSLFPQVQANANFSGGKDPNTQSTYNILALDC